MSDNLNKRLGVAGFRAMVTAQTGADPIEGEVLDQMKIKQAVPAELQDSLPALPRLEATNQSLSNSLPALIAFLASPDTEVVDGPADLKELQKLVRAADADLKAGL